MQIVLLVLALSVDVFVASMACGAEHISIEKKTALCISLVCSGVLFLSLVAGNLLYGILRKETAEFLGFAGLLAVGIYKLTEYGVKVYIRKHKFLCKRIKITFSQVQFILSIYNNPVEADKDRSATMSVAEGAFFALAMWTFWRLGCFHSWDKYMDDNHGQSAAWLCSGGGGELPWQTHCFRQQKGFLLGQRCAVCHTCISQGIIRFCLRS